MPAAAARSSARSARSSTCRAASRATARPTTSRRSSATIGPRASPLLHHRRQFRPQQGMGSDLRPARQVARGRQDSARPDDSGRHDVPQDSEFCGEVQARRRHARVPRAREHQPGQSAAKKRQNKITEYRKMLLAWKAQGIFTYAGYILGFPGDTPESIRRDIAIIQRELPLDMLEFNILTPLPGSEDLGAVEQGRRHGRRSQQIRSRARRHGPSAHDARGARCDLSGGMVALHTPEHVETLLRRAVVTNIPLMSFAKVLVQFMTMMQVEKVHPLQSGLIRLRHISEARTAVRDRARVLFTLFLSLLPACFCPRSGGWPPTRPPPPTLTGLADHAGTTGRRKRSISFTKTGAGAALAHQPRGGRVPRAAAG